MTFDQKWDEVMWAGPDVHPTLLPSDSTDGFDMTIGDPVKIVTPLLKMNIQIRRGKSLIVDGNIERLWLRTHFRGLLILLLTAMPTSLPPVGEDPFDKRLRRLYNPKLKTTAILDLLKTDDELANRAHKATTEGKIAHRKYQATTIACGGSASAGEIEKLMKLRGGGNSPTLTEVLKMMNLVFKMIDFVLKTMIFVFTMMNSLFKMLDFAVKRMNSAPGTLRLPVTAGACRPSLDESDRQAEADRFAFKMMNFVPEIMNFVLIICTENDEFRIKDDGFCTGNDEFVLNMMNSVLKVMDFYRAERCRPETEGDFIFKNLGFLH